MQTMNHVKNSIVLTTRRQKWSCWHLRKIEHSRAFRAGGVTLLLSRPVSTAAPSSTVAKKYGASLGDKSFSIQAASPIASASSTPTSESSATTNSGSSSSTTASASSSSTGQNVSKKIRMDYRHGDAAVQRAYDMWLADRRRARANGAIGMLTCALSLAPALPPPLFITSAALMLANFSVLDHASQIFVSMHMRAHVTRGSFEAIETDSGTDGGVTRWKVQVASCAAEREFETARSQERTLATNCVSLGEIIDQTQWLYLPRELSEEEAKAAKEASAPNSESSAGHTIFSGGNNPSGTEASTSFSGGAVQDEPQWTTTLDDDASLSPLEAKVREQQLLDCLLASYVIPSTEELSVLPLRGKEAHPPIERIKLGFLRREHIDRLKALLERLDKTITERGGKHTDHPWPRFFKASPRGAIKFISDGYSTIGRMYLLFGCIVFILCNVSIEEADPNVRESGAVIVRRDREPDSSKA
ncbi:unnamed protein product [Amoebophrya sp. A25]|nr:unnamed protein product [Amoebophrya sp. A25]|eukprot:GSA25T00004424001.1